MKKVLAWAVVVATAFATTIPANAADDKKAKDPEAMFKKLDKDSDGKVTFEEFKGKKEGDAATKAEKAFKAKDKDGDGSLTLEEFKGKAKKKKKDK